MIKETIKRGDILLADLDPIIGSEQGGERPVLVVQNDVGNLHSPTIVVAIISSKVEKGRLPTHVFVQRGVLPFDSIICVEQIRTIDKSRIFKYLGRLSDEEMKNVDKALKISVGVRD